MIKSLVKWLRENREWHRHWRKAWSASIRPDSEGVTPFQRRCFAELAKAWPRDAEPPIWVRQGRKEAFFTTAIPGTPLTCWIYHCDAEISGNDIESQFECGGYADPDELLHHLVAAVSKQLGQHTPAV